MKDTVISKDIIYIGADDKNLDLFESQFAVPNGISYNSYLIKDEKNTVLDTIDKRKTDEWISNLEASLNGEKVDFLVVSHMEPDHAYNIELLSRKYPEMKIIGNDKTFTFIQQFFNIPDIEDRKIIVKECDTICLGKHTLQFYMAPMVHWPEVMMVYEQTEKIFFSADAFGKFGALSAEEEWLDEARRYYFNIVGKYGGQVQTILKKAMQLDIKTICPLHGPIIKSNLEYYLNKYEIWSKYDAEEEGIFIAYSSIYDNTTNAVKEFADTLRKSGTKNIVLFDLTREDKSKAIAYAFKYNKIVLASSSYNLGLFPPMEQFLSGLRDRNYQNRRIAFIENGTWAPSAGRCMKNIISEFKNITIVEPIVTIKSILDNESRKKLVELAKNI
jgi:flavorubredoxin